MKRAKLGMMRRNAVIVAGNLLANSQDETLLNELQSIAQHDEDDMVRNTAIEVLKQRTNS
jgi:epoxyqueuosine reductase QueG